MANCPSCQAPLPEPAPSYCPVCGKSIFSGTPWEQGTGGRVSAFIETVKRVLSMPVEFFDSMSVSGGMGDPLIFGIIAGSIGAIFVAVYQALLRVVLGSGLLALGGERAHMAGALSILQGGMGLVIQVVLAPVGVALGLFIASGLWHLALLLLSSAKQSFEATFRVCCYAQAAALLSIVPLCGGLIGFIWWLVVAVIGLSRAHKIGVGMAIVAVLLPIVVICCCCCGGFTLLTGTLGGLSNFRDRF